MCRLQRRVPVRCRTNPYIGSDDAAKGLGTALRDEQPAVRQKALYAPGDMGGSTATALLVRASQDPDPVIRQAATDILTDWGVGPGELSAGPDEPMRGRVTAVPPAT